MRKILMLIVFASTFVDCENELNEVNEQFETRSAVEDEKKEGKCKFSDLQGPYSNRQK